MADFWVLIFVLGFFGLCVAFVYGCDKIIGPDDEADLDDEADDGRVLHRGRGDRVNGENIAGLVLAVLLSVYLVAALLFPERF